MRQEVKQTLKAMKDAADDFDEWDELNKHKGHSCFVLHVSNNLEDYMRGEFLLLRVMFTNALLPISDQLGENLKYEIMRSPTNKILLRKKFEASFSVLEMRNKNAKIYMENKQKIYMDHCRVYSGEKYNSHVCNHYMDWTYLAFKDYKRFDEWCEDSTNLKNIEFL